MRPQTHIRREVANLINNVGFKTHDGLVAQIANFSGPYGVCDAELTPHTMCLRNG